MNVSTFNHKFLVFFDFDQTLSVWHIFYVLSGHTSNGVSIRPPFARTERGQLARLAELDETPEFKPGGFALSAFGGEKRVQELRAFLIKLCKKRVECFICTRGLVGPVRWCLDQLGLLDYFSKIYGNIGESYGATEYDIQVTDSHCDFQDLLGDPGQTGWQSKQNVVARCLHERGLGYKDAVFVDDQEHEISAMAATCTTVLVESQQGIGPAEFELIWQKALCSQQTGSPLPAEYRVNGNTGTVNNVVHSLPLLASPQEDERWAANETNLCFEMDACGNTSRYQNQQTFMFCCQQ